MYLFEMVFVAYGAITVMIYIGQHDALDRIHLF